MSGASWPWLVALATVLVLLAGAGRAQGLDALRAAAEAGDPAALFALAEMRERGQQVEQDLAAAVELYRLAAERGHPEAQYRLGLALAGGLGVPDDRTEGLVWLSLAATDAAVAPLAGALREAVAAQLDDQAVAEAERRVAAFRAAVGPARLPAIESGPDDPIARLLASLPEDHCGPVRQVREADGRRRIEVFVRDGTSGTPEVRPVDGDLELSLVRLDTGLCATLRLIDEAGVIDPELAPILRDQNGRTKEVFVEGDLLVIEVPPREQAGHVALDYVTHDGHVLHMLPAPGDVALAAAEPLVVGAPNTSPRFEVAPPFGEDLVVVRWSAPPFAGGPRPQVETLDDYLRALRPWLTGAEPVRAGFSIVRTAPG